MKEQRNDTKQIYNLGPESEANWQYNIRRLQWLFHIFSFPGTPSAQEGWAISFLSKGGKNHPLSKTDWLLNTCTAGLKGEKASCPARVLKSFWEQQFLRGAKIYINPYLIDSTPSQIQDLIKYLSVLKIPKIWEFQNTNPFQIK